MKRWNIWFVFGLMVLLAAVKSRSVYAQQKKADAETEAMTEDEDSGETVFYGKIISFKDGKLTLEKGTVDFENGMTFSGGRKKTVLTVTGRTVVKDTIGTEGDVFSAENLQEGMIIAVSCCGEEAQAVTVMRQVTEAQEPPQKESPKKEPPKSGTRAGKSKEH